jgi:hypothetical protein
MGIAFRWLYCRFYVQVRGLPPNLMPHFFPEALPDLASVLLLA